MRKKKYSSKMLPNVDYKYFYRDGLDAIVDLEFETQNRLKIFADRVKELLADSNRTTYTNSMVLYFSAYLGFMSVAGLGAKEAKNLEDDLVKLITREANDAYKLYEKFPISPGQIKDNEEQKNNLQKLRDVAPGSIIVQTLRLGRDILDIIDELIMSSTKTSIKEEPIFSPTLPLMLLLKTTCKQNLKELKRTGGESAVLHHINHTAVQIGWLMGYFRHLFGDKTPLSSFISYVKGVITVHIEYGSGYLKIPTKKLNNFIQNQ